MGRGSLGRAASPDTPAFTAGRNLTGVMCAASDSARRATSPHTMSCTLEKARMAAQTAASALARNQISPHIGTERHPAPSARPVRAAVTARAATIAAARVHAAPGSVTSEHTSCDTFVSQYNRGLHSVCHFLHSYVLTMMGCGVKWVRWFIPRLRCVLLLTRTRRPWENAWLPCSATNAIIRESG